MCNLNLIIKSKVKDKYDLFAFLTAVTTASYNSNNNGDGIYTDNGIFFKSEKKIDYKEFIELLAKSNFILTHQRLATSGKTEEYTQPFESEEFVLGHNGIFHKFSDKKHSDTFVFFQKFIEEFEKQEGERKTKIKIALNNLLKEETGSYSIFLFDKVEKVLYYFKNSFTSIYAYRNSEKNFMFLTTKESNSAFLRIFKENFREIKLNDYEIYRISILNERVIVNSIGKIKKKIIKITQSTFDLFDYLSKSDIKVNLGLITNYRKEKCISCDKPTEFILPYSSRPICEECFSRDYYDILEEELEEIKNYRSYANGI